MTAGSASDRHEAESGDVNPLQPGNGARYRIDRRISNAARTHLWERSEGEPSTRPLEIFALNAEVSRLEGGVVSLEVPYEPLQPGPVGSVVEVSNVDADGVRWNKADLENRAVLMRGGYRASLSLPEFHQQMVYAVAMLTYKNFSLALGRDVAWAFDPPDDPSTSNRLTLKPYGAVQPNAWYDGEKGEIVFGYFKPKVSTQVVPKEAGYLFNSMSHDIIAHEMSHALLDGLRSHFDVPSHPHVLAFHEAFADLIAFFQHFTFEGVVSAQLDKSKGRLEHARNLIDIAKVFGSALGLEGGALRTVWNPSDDKEKANETVVLNAGLREPHELGRVLVYAIFDAFLTIYNRKAKRYIKLATGGSGTLPDGDIPIGLRDFLVDEARKLAKQFLTICIRAIDYCPPVDVRFGDYLRAIITADSDVVSDDKWAYREAIIKSFGGRQIFGEGTSSMTEDALIWNRPRVNIEPQEQLSFGNMRFDADPARPADAREMRIQAGAVGQMVCQPEYAEEFGIVVPGSANHSSARYDLPVVTSVRPMRRIGPDQNIGFDLVAEVVQLRRVRRQHREMHFFGGSTIIIGPRGEVRYVIRKRVDNDTRVEEQFKFALDGWGRKYWKKDGNAISVNRSAVRMMCCNGESEQVSNFEI